MTPNGSSSQFVLTTQLLNLLGLIQKNVQQGNAPNVVILNGGTAKDLFAIAATVYGDPSKAFALARYNGLISPILVTEYNYQILLPASLGT